MAVTGHRPNAFNGDYSLRGPVWDPVYMWFNDQLDDLQPDTVFVGMALGVDTVAAKVCVARGQRFVACVPFEGQQDRWRQADKEQFVRLLAEAAEVAVVSPGGFAPWKMHRRNQFMVDAAYRAGGELLAVWNGNGGGTQNCVRYAERVGCPVRRFTGW